MKKSKRIISAILCAAALTGAFALSACNIKKTDHDGDNQTDHVPVTTVANEEEWKKAFDVFSLDSFSFVTVIADGYLDRTMTGTVDVTGFKFSSEVVATNPEEAAHINNEVYLEYDNNFFWQWHNPDNEVTKINLEQGETAQEVFDRSVSDASLLVMPLYYTFYASGNLGESKTLSELYFEFTYKDGRYVSETIKQESEDEENIITITFADGVVSEFEFLGGSTEQEWKYTIKINAVNSTTVTTPAEARTAIDAEKDKMGNVEVVSEAEWKKAFDLASWDNFTLVSIAGGFKNSVLYDLANGKSLQAISGTNGRYFEYSDGAIWFASLSGSKAEAQKETDCADAATAKQNILSFTGMELITSNADKYSDFEYNSEDGYYVYIDNTTSSTCKIKIAEGRVTECITDVAMGTSKIAVKYEFKDVNTTDLQTPEWARTAIDAAKAKG